MPIKVVNPAGEPVIIIDLESSTVPQELKQFLNGLHTYEDKILDEDLYRFDDIYDQKEKLQSGVDLDALEKLLRHYKATYFRIVSE